MNKKLTSSLFTSLVTWLFFHKFNFFLIYRWVLSFYHWSNQHKHFNKSNIMNLLRHYSPRLTKSIQHFMIKIIIRMASAITHVPHLFSMKHVFLENKKEEKTWIRTFILATQNSINKSTLGYRINVQELLIVQRRKNSQN